MWLIRSFAGPVSYTKLSGAMSTTMLFRGFTHTPAFPAPTRRTTMTHPVQVIERDNWTEVWHCAQPARYVVVRQEWNDSYTERHIYQVEER